MHESVMAFVKHHIKRHHVEGGHVLEVGSYNVNGSVRPYLESLNPKSYTGVDIAKGPGVDLVYDPEEEALPVNEDFYNLVISTEMLEHAKDWVSVLGDMVRALSVDGLLLITARGPGFQYHNPPDYWRFTPEDITRAMVGWYGLNTLYCGPDPQAPGVFYLGAKCGLFQVAKAPKS
jgi:hypothetical protein